MPLQKTPRDQQDPGARSGPSSPFLLERVKEDLKNAQNALAALLQETHYFKENNRRQESELREAKTYIHQLEGELQEYETKLCRSMDFFKICDGWISEKLNTIYHCLVNRVLELPEADHIYQSWLSIQKALNAERYAGIIVLDLPPEITVCLQPELLAFGIFRILWHYLFAPRWIGVAGSTGLVLDQLYHGLKKVKPTIGCLFIRMNQTEHLLMPDLDPESITTWRSNTFRSYKAFARHDEHLENDETRAVHDIKDIIQTVRFTKVVEWSKTLDRLMDEVVKPISFLATQIRYCEKEYHWSWYNASQGMVRKQPLDNYDIIKSKIHVQYSKATFLDMPEDAVVGKLVRPMYPAIMRSEINRYSSCERLGHRGQRKPA